MHLFLLIYVYFWPHHAACGILVPQPGIKPALPMLGAQNLPLDHQESPLIFFFFNMRYPKKLLKTRQTYLWVR